MPEHRRTPLGLVPATSPSEVASESYVDPFARGMTSGTSSVAAPLSVPAFDTRESSPPEGTLVRSTSSSQVLPKASATADVSPASSLTPLVSSVAHDLNNLLQIISTTTQLLRLREQNKDSQQFLADIASATERAARLSGQLLEAARLERRRHSESDCDG